MATFEITHKYFSVFLVTLLRAPLGSWWGHDTYTGAVSGKRIGFFSVSGDTEKLFSDFVTYDQIQPEIIESGQILVNN